MKINRALLITCITIALIGGCKKEESDDTPAPTPPTSTTPPVLLELFADNVAAATQSFTMTAAVGGEVIADQGTRLDFEPGAFLHANGTPVIGAVNLKVVEALSIGDMIWLNKQTVGNDNGTLKLLRSGGAISVSATQGGSTLRIAQGGLVVRIPTTVGDPAMQLFSGSEDADGNMIWSPIDSSSVTVDPGYYVDPYYVFAADSLQWINCDYFYSYPSTTTLQSTIPAGQSSDSTQVWIAFPSENAVMQMSYSTSQTYTTWQVVPVGMQAVIVGLQQTPSGFSSSFTTVTIASSMSVPMTFSPTTLTQFEADVDAL
ncbi:MAG: hypothetical protein ABI432_17905 [Flavobacteriales bacterium]